MFLSNLRKLKWAFYQGSRVGNETGVLTVWTANPDKKAKPEQLMIEMGWLMINRLGDDEKKIIRNVKHPITHNFTIDQEADGGNIEKFVDTLEWQPMVLKTLPQDALRP